MWARDDEDELVRNIGFEAGMRDREQLKKPSPIPAKAPEEPTGAHARYTARIGKFEKDGRPVPRLRHHALWLLHNCVAHPLLAVMGKNVSPVAVEFHELTSQWLNHKTNPRWPSPPFEKARYRYVVEFQMPEVKKTGFWVLHNVVAHTAIGLLPCRATFDLHDWTAKKMEVPHWV